MKLIVYKGFDINYLETVNQTPLIENNIKEKLDVLGFDKQYSNELEIAIIIKEGTYWITYEEFSLIKNIIEMKIKSDDLEVQILNNNIYPQIYPLAITIPEDIVQEIIVNAENNEKEELSKKASKVAKIYSEISLINNKYYVTYYNDEVGNDLIKTDICYDDDLEIKEVKYEVDYIIDLSDDPQRYIKHIDNLENGNYNSVGIVLTCNTNLTKTMLKSIKAYLKLNKKFSVYNYHEKSINEEVVDEDLRRIAKDVIKIKNFQDFRNISFYEDPNFSNKTVDISQTTIMKNIIDQAENALNDKMYRDIFITASTGAGKSVIFQIPSIYLAENYNRLTIIIVPIKELMVDQYEKLFNSGYKGVAFLNSDKTVEEKDKILENIKDGIINLLYLSPETLLSYSIDSIIGDREIGLVIVDEAHIVTTWGVGFRPDYWYLGSYINKLRKETNRYGVRDKKLKARKFPICAFTATAVNGGHEDTISDTIISLYMEDPIKYIGNVRRDNIKFDIKNYEEKLTNEEYEKQKIDTFDKRLFSWIDKKEKTITYFPYHRLANEIYDGFGVYKKFREYKPHLGIYTGQTQMEIRRKSMDDFKSNDICCMLATKAFGMGIDIDDVSNVYHYAVSGNLNDYVQEIGRVARKPNSIGYAITDYYDSDMKYMKRLFGMSQIRHFQVSKVLSIIYDVYKTKNNRNFLITPKMFSGIFGKRDEESETKLKIVLLMLEKDFYDKFGFKVLVSRPRSVFTNAFVVVDRLNEAKVLNNKYSKYFTFISYGRNKELDSRGSLVSDFGDIYSIDLKSIWEELYPKMSFPSFKYEYFSSNGQVLSEIKPFIKTRLKTTVTTKGELLLSNLKGQALEEINYITSKLRGLQGKYFSKEEFEESLYDRYGNTLRAKVISNSYLDLIDENNRCYKARVSASGIEEFILSNGLYGDLASSVISKSNLLRELSNNSENTITKYLSSDPNSIELKMLKLLSILDLASYETLGGDNPEIFIRLNDPRKIEKIVYRNIFYTNNYVDMAREKHNRAIKILNYFFRDIQTDEERWDFIESYFLGEDIINLDDFSEDESI